MRLGQMGAQQHQRLQEADYEQLDKYFHCVRCDEIAYNIIKKLNQKYLELDVTHLYLQQYLIMAEGNQEIEIQQPAQVVEQQHSKHTDHIPLKDEFSSDLSEIDIAELADRQQEAHIALKNLDNRPKRKKIIKNFRWKSKWVKIPNVVPGSQPILQKRWVKVKYVPNEEQICPNIQQEGAEKDKHTLSMAQAIIQGQLNHQ